MQDGETTTSVNHGWVGLAVAPSALPADYPASNSNFVAPWQTDAANYQFWTETDANGHFEIRGVPAGNYSLYGARFSEVIGDILIKSAVSIGPAININAGDIYYKVNRYGPNLWQVGSCDQSIGEFFVPSNINAWQSPRNTTVWSPYDNSRAKDPLTRTRTWGVWNYFAQQPITQFTVGKDHESDTWPYVLLYGKQAATTSPTHAQRTIFFNLNQVAANANYTLRLPAVGVGTSTNLQVQVNSNIEFDSPKMTKAPYNTSPLDTIFRPAPHGLYAELSLNVPSSHLVQGSNRVDLFVYGAATPDNFVEFDCVRLEGPNPPGVVAPANPRR